MSSYVTLPGTQREHPVNSVRVGMPQADEIIQLTIILRRRNNAPVLGSSKRHLSHQELAEFHGADPADISAIEAFAYQHHFSIVRVDPAARAIILSGRLAALSTAFGADVELRWLKNKVFRSRRGHLQLPASLAGRVMAVVGFDQRPAARPHHRVRMHATQPVQYTPPQLAQIYNFPQTTGIDQTIALIELGGGFNNADLQTYWQQLGLNDVTVTAISVDGAQNNPTGDPSSADGEVTLDIEVAGAIAPGAHLAVYFAPNTDQGFLDAINTAIHDRVRKPSVISISWGSAESEWTPQSKNAFHAAFHDAALLGISVCVAAGDNGSSDGEADGRDHVDFPASSSWVLACGGTSLIASNGTIQSETVWNNGVNGGATGGGVSNHFSKPKYQANINVPAPSWGTVNKTGRGVPDVAAVADPATGYAVFVDGQDLVFGGTSAVAPLWAGLIALCNEQLGKNLGWIHDQLYGTFSQHKALNDITSGTNGDFKAAVGWDACTGLGSPNGQAMLALLKP
ncbi:MAG: S8/S53 family peptidase [Acidobacteriaceae bacterium]|nr:S8/S53 family peptidase [Acidobacteriaceae bacterium]MBV9765281.1 S8/S53 family peptidase [Acidobacteriaceae bacterium]